MYDAIAGQVAYKRSGPGVGQGDAVWTCEHRAGNCADLHSLFIAMARGSRLPAKFEIGFAIPAKPGPVTAYQSWAWFCPDSKGWVPVELAGANRRPEEADYYFGNLDENRISFSVGRDIELVPRQNGPPLNFFIDPYVEVGGKAYAPEKIHCRHSFSEGAKR